MNKKLFLAGVALLAAVGFTSCNSDTPIDSSNPSGVTPTTAYHKVGGDYDWTAIAKNNAELKKFWDEDATEVGKVVAKKGTANILLDVSGFELDGSTIKLPDFWNNDGTGADKKVVNILITGNFKKADFLRASKIKGDGSAFPVVINTDNLKGAEVNFTFDAEKFDLELETKYTRSTLNGTYHIGYMYFDGAQNLSAVQIKGGTVEAVDLGSKGDIEEDGGDVVGAWYDSASGYGQKPDLSARGEADIWITEKGIGLGDHQKVVVKNLAVEDDIALTGNIKNGAGKITKLDVIAFAHAEYAVTVTLPKESYAAAIVGVKEAKNNVEIANDTDLKNIDAIEKVTIIDNGAATVDLTIEKDIFTDVTFETTGVNFSVDKLNTLDNVTFGLTPQVNISVKADDQTLTFNGVKFNTRPLLLSENEITLDADTYNDPLLYQWIVDKADETKGSWRPYKKASDITAYNAGQTEYEFTNIAGEADNAKMTVYIDANGQLKAGGKASDTDKANIAAAKNLIKIKQLVPAGIIVNLIPANFNIVLDGNCKFYDATTPDALNKVWGYKEQVVSAGTAVAGVADVAWYGVKFNDIDYKWVPTLDAKGGFNGYILVKNQ